MQIQIPHPEVVVDVRNARREKSGGGIKLVYYWPIT
jgi:hypothetical protein